MRTKELTEEKNEIEKKKEQDQEQKRQVGEIVKRFIKLSPKEKALCLIRAKSNLLTPLEVEYFCEPLVFLYAWAKRRDDEDMFFSWLFCTDEDEAKDEAMYIVYCETVNNTVPTAQEIEANKQDFRFNRTVIDELFSDKRISSVELTKVKTKHARFVTDFIIANEGLTPRVEAMAREWMTAIENIELIDNALSLSYEEAMSIDVEIICREVDEVDYEKFKDALFKKRPDRYTAGMTSTVSDTN